MVSPPLPAERLLSIPRYRFLFLPHEIPNPNSICGNTANSTHSLSLPPTKRHTHTHSNQNQKPKTQNKHQIYESPNSGTRKPRTLRNTTRPSDFSKAEREWLQKEEMKATRVQRMAFFLFCLALSLFQKIFSGFLFVSRENSGESPRKGRKAETTIRTRRTERGKGRRDQWREGGRE